MNTQTAFSQNSTDIKDVESAVEHLRMAMIKADSVGLEELSSAKLSYGHSGGQLQTKQEFIHSITSGASVFISIEFTNQTIVIDNNTAIVRHVLTASTNDKGKGPGNVKLGILLVWVKTDIHKWQLLARQAVKIP